MLDGVGHHARQFFDSTQEVQVLRLEGLVVHDDDVAARGLQNPVATVDLDQLVVGGVLDRIGAGAQDFETLGQETELTTHASANGLLDFDIALELLVVEELMSFDGDDAGADAHDDLSIVVGEGEVDVVGVVERDPEADLPPHGHPIHHDLLARHGERDGVEVVHALTDVDAIDLEEGATREGELAGSPHLFFLDVQRSTTDRDAFVGRVDVHPRRLGAVVEVLVLVLAQELIERLVAVLGSQQERPVGIQYELCAERWNVELHQVLSDEAQR